MPTARFLVARSKSKADSGDKLLGVSFKLLWRWVRIIEARELVSTEEGRRAVADAEAEVARVTSAFLTEGS